RDGAMLIAQRVVAAVAGQAIAHAASDAASVVTLSVGVASGLPLPGPLDQAAAALLAQADAALYEAKRSGRNRAVAAPATPAAPAAPAAPTASAAATAATVLTASGAQ
ncbi:MAG: diguanylate cyclase, partial [Burkholderiaceae bacterium]|nr:diguanylate cyclase [Burkholderiaceae bacterium]